MEKQHKDELQELQHLTVGDQGKGAKAREDYLNLLLEEKESLQEELEASQDECLACRKQLDAIRQQKRLVELQYKLKIELLTASIHEQKNAKEEVASGPDPQYVGKEKTDKVR